MKVDDIKECVRRIRDLDGDSEGQHSLEDELYPKVLDAIAKGAENPEQLASAALEVQLMDFDRWYA